MSGYSGATFTTYPPFVGGSYASASITPPVLNTFEDVLNPPESDGVYAVVAITAMNSGASGNITYDLAIVDDAGTTIYLAPDESLSPLETADAILTTSEPVYITGGAVIKARQKTGTAGRLIVRVGYLRVV